MPKRLLATALLVCAPALAGDGSPTGGPSPAIKLSENLTQMLRAEMRELAKGMQELTMSLATADWESVERTGEAIRSGYIMKKALTPAQSEELHQKLPAAFRRLDAEFHARAGKLAAAARAGDAELAAYHHSRLLEGCMSCHAVFAAARFPGFDTAPASEHRH